MTEDEAFIRAVVDNPGEDTPRLVYADWLDDRSDPRGPYLRAEWEWARTGKKVKALRAGGVALDPVWVYRVSRPPVGICFRLPIMEKGAHVPSLSRADVDECGKQYGGFPSEYVAFLLNYDGYGLVEAVDFDDGGIEEFCSISGGFTIGELVANIEFEYEEDGLQQSFYSLPQSRLPIAFMTEYGIGDYYSAVVIVKGKRSPCSIDYYSNPLANDVPIDEAESPRNCYKRLASSLPVLIQMIEDCFEPDDSEPEESSHE